MSAVLRVIVRVKFLLSRRSIQKIQALTKCLTASGRQLVTRAQARVKRHSLKMSVTQLLKS